MQLGGRHLWEWSFLKFCAMLLRVAWTVLGVRRSVTANQSLDERFSSSCRHMSGGCNDTVAGDPTLLQIGVLRGEKHVETYT
ncbi:MAG: hypothetical protein J07HN4v3_01732 [Halonotius sp. J07HN4]|nr:MAG: hypothetical protein J07HN4v3_01732 [Halonotius sp. J07HN4]